MFCYRLRRTEHIFVNNKGTDKPAHLCSLIQAFAVCCLEVDDTIPLVFVPEISILWLISAFWFDQKKDNSADQHLNLCRLIRAVFVYCLHNTMAVSKI